jgi:hypothetical protein
LYLLTFKDDLNSNSLEALSATLSTRTVFF